VPPARCSKLAEPEPEGPALLQRSGGAIGSRSEVYALTDRGKQFVNEVRSALNGPDPEPLETHTVESYAEATILKKLWTGKLRQIAWDDSRLTLTVTPIETAMSDEVSSWMKEFMSEETSRTLTDSAVEIKFASAEEAVHFKLRWVARYSES
jgi:hypothetical protein